MKKQSKTKPLFSELSSLRGQVRMYLAKAHEGIVLSEAERRKLGETLLRLNDIKAALIDQGHDPSLHSRFQKPRSRTGRGRRPSGRSGGIGIYGLGSGIKIWR